MGRDSLKIPYVIPTNLLRETKRSSFDSEANVFMIRVGYTDDIGIQTWGNNDLERNINIQGRI